MAHDVFISYAHTDKPTGDAVCATLEARGIRCWMAPRDVLPGVIYSAAIVEAIHASRVFVLVFSAEANVSPHVMRELERAVHDGIPVLPLRIEDVPLSSSMEYFISTPHWLDALTPPLEKHLVQLAETVKLLLAKVDGDARAAQAHGVAAPATIPAKVIEPVMTSPAPAPVEPAHVDAIAAETVAKPPAQPPSPAPSSPRVSSAPPPAVGPTAARSAGLSTFDGLAPPRAGRPAPVAADRSRIAPARSLRAFGAVGALAVVIVVGALVAFGMLGDGGSANASPTAGPSPTAQVAFETPSATRGATVLPSPSFGLGVWIPAGRLATGRQEHTATLLENGMVLVAGGTPDPGGSTILDSAELFDPSSGTWITTGSMTQPRVQHMATLLKNGKVLVVGGQGPEGSDIAQAELYDPATGRWSRTGSAHVSHPEGTLTLLPNGKVLLAGGIPGGQYDSEIYNPSTGKWSAGGETRFVRTGATATVLSNGQVLLAGGGPPDSPAAEPAYTSAEIYDPGTGRWKVTGSMAIARAYHVAALLPDGRVLVVGGAPNRLGPMNERGLATAEIYDPGTGEWSPTGDLTTARYRALGVALLDGSVLIAGGGSGEVTFATSELYDPAAGAWSVGPQMLFARFRFAMTALEDGSALVVGGDGGADSQRSAEILDTGE